MSLRLSLPSVATHFLSDRLFINTVRECDAEALYNFHIENKEHLAPWDPPYPNGFFTESYWHAYCERAITEFEDLKCIRYLLWQEESLVGSVSVSGIEQGPFQNARLGYKIAKKYEGQGLAREGVAAVVSELFKAGFHRVEANYIPSNIRSGNLLKSLGFHSIGIAPKYLLINNSWQDHMLTAITVEDWSD